MALVVTIDAGTTGIRALSVDEAGKITALAYRELTQYFPAPGLVEHDPAEIWSLTQDVLIELAAAIEGQSVAAIGITNQRETVLAWDRTTGQALYRAIVWQDRRSTAICEELEAKGALSAVREATGLVLDPYFSASKLTWLSREGYDLCAANVIAG
ncbi:MAG: FGGY family carbohydrate kinase, partial [Actinobacteria bacterium]|nr:FGGY family carbohydrate kinase [Actinomycetota bacterium]